MPPYVALTKPDEDEVAPPQPVPSFSVKTEVGIQDDGVSDNDTDDEDDEDDDDDEGSVEDPETDSKPKYLPPIFASNLLRPLASLTAATSTPPLIPGFPHPHRDNGAVVRPLPPEIALRLHLDFGQNEAARQKLSPIQHQQPAESSGPSNGSNSR